MQLRNKTIGIIGTGRVGCAIGYGLSKSPNVQIRIFANDKVKRKARNFYQLLNLKYQALSNQKVAQLADIVFITTNDSEIKRVYQEIYPYLRPNQIVIHCSGAYSNAILQKPQKAKNKRIVKIGIWPIQTFTTLKPNIGMLKNCFYVIEATGKAKRIGKEIVDALQGHSIFISNKDKTLYHLIGVFASNYLVALLSAVADLAKYLKQKPAKIFQLFTPIIAQTLENIYKTGVEKALSGPVARGDTDTINLHLTVLSRTLPKLLPMYKVLGLKTLDLIKDRPAIAKKIKAIFAQNEVDS
ncbi:MAG: DUF2520 domain-containing protein [candidate division WOR-3 bacterium]|nr:DUF2520 domain-containing protein [candidate division WOR-3 bacterium]